LENAIVDRHGITSLRRWAPSKPYKVEITMTVEETGFWGEYSFVIKSGQRGTFKVGREACRVGKAALQVNDKFEIREGKLIVPPERFEKEKPLFNPSYEPTALALPYMGFFSPQFSRMRQHLRGNFYSIFPNTLREPQKPSTEVLLTDHGGNFASVVQQLRRKSNWFPDLRAALGRVIDGVSDVRVKEAGGYLVVEVKHKDLGDDSSRATKSPWFELAQESDGTLRMLGMLVALYQNQPTRRTLLALEEPENALHPGALAVLHDVLKEATRRNQILITTQSPDLISLFKVNELRIVERVNGVTEIGPVDETQRETIEDQLFSAGDILRIEGLRREAEGVEGAKNA
jgi:hypothetical protein